jgi:hypothetical protein
MYRKIREQTKFGKNGYIITIKADISAVQTWKEKATRGNQQNAHTVYHVHIDNCIKTIKVLDVSNIVSSPSGQGSYHAGIFFSFITNLIVSMKTCVHFVGLLSKITDYCVRNEQFKVFKTPKEVLIKQRNKSSDNFRGEEKRNYCIRSPHVLSIVGETSSGYSGVRRL